VKPRPFSRLRDGKLEWVAPAEPGPAAKVRSRRETDAEVRARLVGVDRWLIRGMSGRQLDEMLEMLKLPERKMIDEVV
jgi:hypothetical protein